MSKWKQKINDIFNQKAAIEFGAIAPTLIERTIDERIQRDAASAVRTSNHASVNQRTSELEAIERFYENARRID